MKAARRVVGRAAAAILLLAGAALPVLAQTGAPETPALVVDVATGKVLYSQKATEPWYPASITKLMTTYVALDLVRQGRVGMDTLLTMSAEAAAEPPSKLGLKPGGTITLENALKIIMVKSANDLAYMVGENLGGSVEGFAAMMNDRAHRLGMYESRWYNPNGLPDPRQQTSARDMAVLARALLIEFPDYEYLFHIGAVKLGNQVMRNHNGMLGRYPGADGMKTGFICSGGFNIVASATQNGRRLITVVMGYPSARERDLRAANLFDAGFNTLGWGSQNVESLPPSGVMSPPDMRPYVCGGKRRQPEEDDETAVVSASAGLANPIASLFAPSTLGTFAGAAPQLGTRKTLGPRVAFAPIPVWLGQSPGSVPGDAPEATPGRAVRTATKPVRTRATSLASGVSTASTQRLQADGSPVIEGGASVQTLKAGKRPTDRAALKAALAGRPAAEAKSNGTKLSADGLNPDGKAAGSGSGSRKTTKAARKTDARKTDARKTDAKKSASAAKPAASAKQQAD